jgi:methylmalonyl-CoA mutase N-terminal domain/subunit
MEVLFDGIPLDQVSTSMTINGPAIIIWAFYIAAAERQGVDSAKLRGTIQNDILKEYMAQHAWCFPIEPALRLIVDCFEWGARHAPLWNTISISGYHIREAGSTAAQELAFTLADGFTYVERGIARGSTSTTSRRASRSSGTSTTISSRRSPSCARRGASGRAT